MNSVRTSQETHYISGTKIDGKKWSMKLNKKCKRMMQYNIKLYHNTE
jgi:hypothetical protein